jgi:hypothetical protein
VTGGAGITSEADELIMLDSGNANTPYILRTVKDINGLVTAAPVFEMDGITVYGAFVGPGVPVSGGGGGGLTNESDDLIMLDSGNADTPYLLRTVKDATGAVLSAAEFLMDGVTPYAAFVGPGVAPNGQPTISQEADPVVLYDLGVSPAVPFIRPIVFDGSGGFVGVGGELQLDGSAYGGYVGPDSPHPPAGYLSTRELRVTEVTGPGSWNPAAQNVSSFRFVVTAGTAIYDGTTFAVGEGADGGNDSLDVPVTGPGGVGTVDVAAVTDTIRVSYVELG